VYQQVLGKDRRVTLQRQQIASGLVNHARVQAQVAQLAAEQGTAEVTRPEGDAREVRQIADLRAQSTAPACSDPMISLSLT
jgi:hypothetical protein